MTSAEGIGAWDGSDLYKRWMITSTTAVNELEAQLPHGLTVQDALRIAQALYSTHAEATRHVYAHAWRRWERWCAGRDAEAFPAAPALICAYLAERASQGLSVGSLDLAVCSISYHHRQRGLDDPTRDEAVLQVRRGLRRLVRAAPRRQARPLHTDDIIQIVTAIDRTTPKGARDAAIILLGFASALRRTELADLTLADVEYRPAGLLLTVRRSKTDPEAVGQRVGVAYGQYAVTDPIKALDCWLANRGTAPGPVFTSTRHGAVTLEPLSGNGIARMLRTRAGDAGLAPERITPHSLRAGHATTAAVAGVGLDRIAAQTRHKRLSTLLERYIRPAQALDLTSSRDLGL